MTTSLVAILAKIHPLLGNLSGIPLGVFVVVTSLTALFLLGYATQGLRVGLELWLAVRSISALRRENKSVNPADVATVLRRKPFRHLWDEYADTLHELRKAGSGSVALTEVRATAPAEMFFTREVLVDSRLFDDFTRHLPGVLTGLGIIGTFAGLLEGLGQFDATSSTTAVAGLKPLMVGVAHAFTASAIAIACAMAVVFISRLALALFYRQVEKLNHAIDALYATGAGEEYLSRLVRSSENSEAHAAQLKQALVEDLTKLMTNLTERQIEAQNRTSVALGTEIGNAIAGSLRDPIKRITEAVEATTNGNAQAVNGMLEGLLTGFMAKLEDTFGGQMRGIREQMDQSMSAMSSVQTALQKLVEDINRSNEVASNRMSGTLEDAMKQSAANQQLLTDQMRTFVADFRKLVTEEQDKSKQVMNDAMATVLQQLTSAIEHMETAQKTATAAEEDRSSKLSGKTQELVGNMSGQVETLLELLGEQVTLTRANLEAISAVATRAIAEMNTGALTMGTAAQRFETAGNAVSEVFDRSARVTEQLNASATSLQSAALAVRQGFDQYDTARKTVEKHVAALTTLIENARAEAGLSKAMITDLDRIVAQLRLAENQSKEYLEGVNRTLEEAFEAFGTQLAGSIKKSVSETDRHLSDGVQRLNGVVQEIGVALARLNRA